MKCSRCSEEAEWIFDDKSYCQDHWEEYCSEEWWKAMNEGKII